MMMSTKQSTPVNYNWVSCRMFILAMVGGISASLPPVKSAQKLNHICLYSNSHPRQFGLFTTGESGFLTETSRGRVAN